jgi:prolyl-tRNA synthetase
MFRAGLLRKLANGLFAYLPFGLRAFRKVEAIIREEMDATGSLEIKPTVVVPGELWKESGRWDAMGPALLRFKNRTEQDFVISPTAEEAFTSLVRDELSSYKQLPISLYQINTKYRDEIRPRYGVMRGREFVMKDAYSYHTDDASLDETYQKMARAYRRIFKRCGLTVIPVSADSGAMGGSGSEEFMVESEIGDNTLLLCEKGDYAANVEKATCKESDELRGARGELGGGSLPLVGTTLPPTPSPKGAQCPPNTPQQGGAPLEPPAASRHPLNTPLEKIATPGVKTIADICAFLKSDVKSSIKTLVYGMINPSAEMLKKYSPQIGRAHV